MSRQEYIHASAVSWCGVGLLFIGASGSGKSSITAELISRGASFIGDDQLLVSEQDGKIYAESPPALAGVIELRDMALIRLPYESKAQIHLIIDCAKSGKDPVNMEILNIPLPRIAVNTRQTGSVAKLTLYAEALQEGRVLPEDWKP